MSWKNTFWIPEEMLDRVDKLVERFPGTYFKVKSFSRPDIWHLVKREGDYWICDCEDFSYRHSRDGKQCDHIRKCRHIKTKYHSQAKKRAVSVQRARRQLLRMIGAFVKDVHRLEWYKERRATAKSENRRKFYSDKASEILKRMSKTKVSGQRIIKKFPELETPEGKNGREKVLRMHSMSRKKD